MTSTFNYTAIFSVIFQLHWLLPYLAKYLYFRIAREKCAADVAIQTKRLMRSRSSPTTVVQYCPLLFTTVSVHYCQLLSTTAVPFFGTQP